MSYRIEITYKTGDSFQSSSGNKEDIFFTWDNLSVAKENLKRIKEHNKYQRSGHSGDRSFVDRPWFSGKDSWEYTITLIDDLNSPVRVGAFWIGYFKELERAEILLDSPQDTDMVYEP